MAQVNLEIVLYQNPKRISIPNGGGKCRAIWKAQSLRSFPFQIVFVSTEGWRRYDFIIVA
jgi:hypothetical protein